MKAVLLIYGVVGCIIFITLLLTYLNKKETRTKRKRLFIGFFIIWSANLAFLGSVIIIKTFS